MYDDIKTNLTCNYKDEINNDFELELDTYEIEVDNKIWIDSLINNIDLEDL